MTNFKVSKSFGFWIILLVVLCLIIFLFNFFPLDSTFVGHDNFSKGLDPTLNLWRTFFSTWRDYRGLGTPGDSESVDFFRNLVLAVVNAVFPIGIWDKVYFFISLFLGVFGMFYLSENIFARLFESAKKSVGKPEGFIIGSGAFISALFYLFNLNTIHVFYGPILMRITFYWVIPWLLYVFIKLSESKDLKLRWLLLFLCVTLLGATSFLTATYFIVLLMILGIFAISFWNPVFQKKNDRKGVFWKAISLIMVYICLNAFWIVPFLNYTSTNSDDVQLSEINFNINQSAQNYRTERYSFSSISRMYSDVMFIKPIRDIKTDEYKGIFAFLDDYSSGTVKEMLLWTNVVFYSIGSIMIILSRKLRYYWIPLLVIFSLFLLRNYLPPLGNLYVFLSNNVPFWNVIFRSSESKFYPILSFAGALSSGILLVFFGRFTQKWFKRVNENILSYMIAIVFLGLLVYTYSSSIFGGIIHDVHKTKIPDEYYQISEIINNDPEYSRVIHLPAQKGGYWKTYSWNYLGSTFLSYLLNKPLVDRTFATESVENDQVLQSLQDIVNYKRYEETDDWFHDLGIKYLIYDKSVQGIVAVQGEEFWGGYITDEYEEMVAYLVDNNYATLVYRDVIDLERQARDLGYWDDLSGDIKLEIRNGKYSEILLYELVDFEPIISLEADAIQVDPYTNLVIKRKEAVQALGEYTKITSDDNPVDSSVFPFLYDESSQRFSSTENNFTQIALNNPQGIYNVDMPGSDAAVLNIYFRINDVGNIEIGVNNLVAPLLSSTELEQFAGGEVYELDSELSMQILNDVSKDLGSYNVLYERSIISTLSNFRLAVGGVVIPLPSEFQNEFEYSASITVNEKDNVQLEVLAPENAIDIPYDEIKYTEDPNCFGDKMSDTYTKDLVVHADSVSVSSKNGSTCWLIDGLSTQLTELETDHIELSFSASEIGTPTEYYANPYNNDRYDTIKSLYADTATTMEHSVREFIDEQQEPTLLNVCMFDANQGVCLNSHQNINLTEQKGRYYILPNNQLSSPNFVPIFRNVTKGFQRVDAELSDFNIISYSTQFEFDVDVSALPETGIDETVTLAENAHLYIPKTISKQSFDYQEDIDAFDFVSTPCLYLFEYRDIVLVDGRFVTYEEDCTSSLRQQLAQNPKNLYISKTDYSLLSGRFPRLAYSGYSDRFIPEIWQKDIIESGKLLQYYNQSLAYASEDERQLYIESVFRDREISSSFKLLYPTEIIDYQGLQRKDYWITQLTQNQGVLVVDDFELFDLPSGWASLALVPDDAEQSFADGYIDSSEQLLPSAWQTNISVNGLNDEEAFLRFNTAFNAQWQIFNTNSLIDALFDNNRVNAEHYKVNGWANGWSFDPSNLQYNADGTIPLIILYTPERLAIVGWIITIVTTVILVSVAWLFKVKNK